MLEPQVINAILADIASGQAAYRAVEAHGVSRQRFYEALNADEALADNYARVMKIGCEPMADDILQISDDPNIDANHKRVMVDSRKWLLSKRLPKKYGDKLDVEHSGGLSITVNKADYG